MEFVVPASELSTTKLITIDGNQAQLIRGEEVNISFDQLSFTKHALPSSLAELQFDADASSRPYIQEEYNDSLYQYQVVYSAPQSVHRVEIDIILTLPEGEYLSKLVFQISPNSHIFEVVVDFGSESSQVAIKKKSEHTVHEVDLLQQFLSFKPDFRDDLKQLSNNRKYYIQHDPDDETLYKSHYIYVQSEAIQEERQDRFLYADANHPSHTDIPFADNAKPILVLNPYRQLNELYQGDYFVVPNLKILESYPKAFKKNMVRVAIHDKRLQRTTQQYRNLSDDDVRRIFLQEIMNNFSYAVLKSIQDLVSRDAALSSTEDKINLLFNVLVPNIYSYEKITQLIQQLTHDLKKMIQSGRVYVEGDQGEFIAVDIGLWVNAIEVQAISESDAAFYGMYYNDLRIKSIVDNKINNDAQAHILMIDCGKGTTDISILKVKNRVPYSKFRTGITGAGNYLTYGFMEAVIRETEMDTENYQTHFVEVLQSIATTKNHVAVLAWCKMADTFKRSHSMDINKAGSLGSEQSKTSGVAFRNTNLLQVINETGLAGIQEEIQAYANRRMIGVTPIIQAYIKELTQEILNCVQQSEVKLSDIKLCLLSGRAFLFQEFKAYFKSELKKAIGGKLPEEELIPDLKINLKQVSVWGGFHHANMLYTDNPTFDVKGLVATRGHNAKTILRSLITGKRLLQYEGSKEAETENVDDYLLKGIRVTIGADKRIKIGEREYDMPEYDSSTTEELEIFFVGSITHTGIPYLVKKAGCQRIQLHPVPQATSGITELIAKSMYPFIDAEFITEQHFKIKSKS